MEISMKLLVILNILILSSSFARHEHSTDYLDHIYSNINIPNLKFEDETYNLMAIYSSATFQKTPDIEKKIKLAVQSLNEAFKNSGIKRKMKLVFLKKIEYTETNSLNTELLRLHDDNDGYNDEIHQERALYNAHFVHMFSSITIGSCGLSYLGEYPVNLDKLFGITASDCLNNFSFSHGIGHQLGNQHTSDQNPIFSYGGGYFYTGNDASSFQTIMSSSSECGHCTRRNFFSSPKKYFEGVPTGDKEYADVARSINQISL